MKIIIIFIDLLMATVLFFVGRFFIKSWAMLFCLGGIIDFIKLGAGIIIVSVFFIILLVFHLVDMTINRDKYRV